MLMIRVHSLGIYPPFQAGLPHNDTTYEQCSVMVRTLNNYFCQCFGYVSAEDPEGTSPYPTVPSFPSCRKKTQLQGTSTSFWTGRSSKQLGVFWAYLGTRPLLRRPKETWSASLPLTNPPHCLHSRHVRGNLALHAWAKLWIDKHWSIGQM